MKLFSFLFLVFLFSFNALSQDGWGYIKTQSDNANFIKPERIIPIVHKESGNAFILIKYKNFSKAYLFDKNQKLLCEIKTTKILENTNFFVGSSASELKFVLFFSNNNNSKFDRLDIDFEIEKFSVSTLGLNIKKEYLINSFENKGAVYLLSILKDTSILKLYELGFDRGIKEREIDLSNESFKKFNGLEASLFYLISSNRTPSKTQSASISYNVPSSLETTSAVNKIYSKDEIISITNDNVSSHTNIIQINVEDGSYKCYEIPKKGFLKEELRSESNSFIFDNYFLSAYATTSKMVLAIYDIKTKSIINEFELSDKDSISFKNSPIIKNRGKRIREKDTNHSAQFLRDIVNSNIGVSVYKRNDVFVVSLGGSEKEQSMTFAIVGGVLGGVVGAMLLSTFDSYSRTNSTKIDCLFDGNFNHLEGELEKNGFDRVKEFIAQEKLQNKPLQTVFKHQQNYVWGYFDRSIGVYKFHKFKE